jgi:hypothetical protein
MRPLTVLLVVLIVATADAPEPPPPVNETVGTGNKISLNIGNTNLTQNAFAGNGSGLTNLALPSYVITNNQASVWTNIGGEVNNTNMTVGGIFTGFEIPVFSTPTNLTITTNSFTNATVSVIGTDAVHRITMTSGTGGYVAGGTICTIKFANYRLSTNFCVILEPLGAAAAALGYNSGFGVGAITTNGYTIVVGSTTSGVQTDQLMATVTAWAP